VLAIDLGLNNLFATSDGDLEGVGYLKQLMRLDYELQRIIKGLQQAGITRYGQCRRYRALVKKIRGFIKTTVDTALKRIMTRRKPRIVIVEALSFKNSNLSKRMNRLLHSFGKGFFEKGLTKYEQELGLEVIKVPAAYTSQMCGGCSYVSPNNRAGNVFQCKVCGKKRHADVHAAQNLLKRFQQGDVLHDMKYLSHTAWWSVLFNKHLDTINRLPLSRSCIIGCARSVWSFLAKKRISDAEYVLTNRNMSLYEAILFKRFEQAKNASSTT
jgi:putative transposase